MTDYVRSAELVSHPVGDLVAVYHKRLGGLCLLDDAAQDVLESFARPRPLASSWEEGAVSQKRVDRLIEQLAVRQFLVTTSESHAGVESEKADHLPRINVVQLVVANGCNFGCTYCFEGLQGADLTRSVDRGSYVPFGDRSKGEVVVNLADPVYSSPERESHQTDPQNRFMSAESAINYVRIAIDLAKRANVPNIMVQFFGGEPLLNTRAILAVLDDIGDGSDFGIKVEYTIVTNGSMVTDEIARRFAENRVGVCVSFDSVNSAARPLKSGRSSVPLVLEGLAKLREHNNRIALNAALCSSTFDSIDETLIKFAASHGIYEIGIVLDLDPTFYADFGGDRIADKVADLVCAGREHGVVVTGYWHQIFQLLSAFDIVRHRGFKNCSAKGAQLSIEPNGGVFSCKAGSGYFGNIVERESLFQSETFRRHSALQFENPAFCKGCEIEGFCAGICLGPLEKKFGTVDAVETYACETYRQVARKLIQLVEPGDVPTFRLRPIPQPECVS